jgi:hypothetical protein
MNFYNKIIKNNSLYTQTFGIDDKKVGCSKLQN